MSLPEAFLIISTSVTIALGAKPLERGLWYLRVALGCLKGLRTLARKADEIPIPWGLSQVGLLWGLALQAHREGRPLSMETKRGRYTPPHHWFARGRLLYLEEQTTRRILTRVAITNQFGGNFTPVCPYGGDYQGNPNQYGPTEQCDPEAPTDLLPVVKA